MDATSATHLLVVYDSDGKITGVGHIDQDHLDREGLGHVLIEVENRHFAQIPVTEDTLWRSHEELMSEYVIEHDNGDAARISRRSGY